MKIPHITIHTLKFEESIRFYEEFTELSIVRDLRERGSDIVFLSNGETDTRIELIRETAQEFSFSAKGLSIGFAVSDLDVLREKTAKAGLDPSPVISPGPDVRFFFVRDPNGVSIQFIEE